MTISESCADSGVGMLAVWRSLPRVCLIADRSRVLEQVMDSDRIRVGEVKQRTNLAAVILRFALGVTFLAHGLLADPRSEAFPPWIPYIVGWAQTIGGLLLLAGIRVGWVALALIPLMMGAASMLAPNGWEFNSPDGGGWEFAVFIGATLGVQALLGPGSLAQAMATPAPQRKPAELPHEIRRAA